MAEQHEWTWEPPTFVRGTPEQINDYKQRFADVKGALGKGVSTSAGICFVVGLEALEQRPELADMLNTSDIEIAKCYNELMKRKGDLKKLHEIMTEMFPDDPEGFSDWATQRKFDPILIEKVLDFYRVEIPTWQHRATNWLVEEMLADGEAHATNKIRVEAINRGIIANSDREWGKLRQLAFRERLTTKEKGFWMKPL